jgi:hypothetical protein
MAVTSPQPIPRVAFSYYGMSCLAKDGGALTRLGVLSESGALGKVDGAGAYQCYAKAMAMGSLEGLIHFCDCYLKGVYVIQDPSFAYECLTSIWDECYRRFHFDDGQRHQHLPSSFVSFGMLFMDGIGTAKDPVLALRLFLYAEFAYGLLKNQGQLKKEETAEAEETEKRIEEISKTYKLKKQDPVFDNDTFADSLDEDAQTSLPVLSYVFAPGSFDKTQGLFDFDLTYNFPPLIVDCGNLYCGFVPGTIHWSFTDVADVKFTNQTTFDRIEGNPGDGWSFQNFDGGNETTLARIVFTRLPKKPRQKERPIKGKA